MTPTRPLAIALPLAATVFLLAACGSSGSASESSAAPTAAVSTATAVATGAPSAELTAWAGQVCDATTALKDSVTGIASAVTSGGDVAANVSSQFGTIQTSASALVETVGAIPADGSGPQAQAISASAAASKSAIDALGTSVTDLTNASGLGSVTAIAAVGSAAKDALTAIGDTGSAISDAVQDGTGTLGQAFAASPSCAALTQ
jgi:hypothetical protein